MFFDKRGADDADGGNSVAEGRLHGGKERRSSK